MKWQTNWQKKHQITRTSRSAIPNSAVLCELKEQNVQQWQNEWERSSKCAIRKSFFPKIEDRLKLRLNATPNFTAIVTGHGNIKSYLYKYKIIDNPMCPCKKGDQTVDHILFDCTLLEQERDKLKAVVTRTENWPVSYNKLSIKYYKDFKEYIDKIIWNKE